VRGGFDYLRPRNQAEAQECKARTEGARYLAGGTDLLVRMKEGKEHPAALVSLRGVAGLSGVRHGGVVRIGAATPIADCLADPALGACFPVLTQAMALMGSVQIRNAATVGGNLCGASPCADTAPPLLVLGARLVVRSAQSGQEQEIPLEEFFLGPRQTRLGPHDLVTAIVLDPPSPEARAVFFKKTRVQMDLALASVAVLLELDGTTCRKARVAAGSLAPTPRRLEAVERVLTGQVLSREVVRRAAEVAQESVAPICDVRAGDDYRRHVTGVFVRRAIEALLGGGRP
jgi:carbon-monoxide dehydrogenase medium subunit